MDKNGQKMISEQILNIIYEISLLRSITGRALHRISKMVKE